VAVIKRHSFLKRHAGMTRPAFSRHYLEHHGPLAAGLGGFRQFAYRYQQNHFDEDFSGNGDPLFDGLTMTFQVPRPDYRQGFFQHPDYAYVRPDEEQLFDLSATVSVLGEEQLVFDRAAGGIKAVILTAQGPADVPAAVDLGAHAFDVFGVRRAIRNRLDTKTATALGFGQSAFAYDLLWEVFFDSADRRQVACKDRRFISSFSSATAGPAPVALAAREYTIF
jgi:hypothetical protein